MEHIKKQLLFLILVLCTMQAQGQIYFYKTFVGSAFDTGEGITQLPDSSYAVTGGSGAFSVNSGQAYLMLTDSLGEHLWTKSYGGNGSDWGQRVIHKPGVGFMIAGTTNSTSDGRYNFYIVTTDEDGNLLNENNFGTTNWDQLWDAVLLDDGGMIVVGETEGETSLKKDMYIARVDDVGDTLWTKVIQSGEDDVAKGVDLLNDTTVVIGGYSWDGAQTNGVLISMHINGQENWRTFYGNPGSAKIHDVEVSNNQIFCGGEIIDSGESQSDWWLLKTDDAGNEIGTKSDPYNGDDVLTDICIVNDDIYMGMKSNSSDLGVFPEGPDAFVLKFHKNLYFNGFSQGYSGVNPDLINEMIATSDGGVAFSGTCAYDRSNPSLETVVLMVKIGPGDETDNNIDFANDLVKVSEVSKPEELIVYPNPTTGALTISGVEEPIDIEIYSVSGKKVRANKDVSKIDISDLKNGVYLLHIIDGDHRIVHRIVKR